MLIGITGTNGAGKGTLVEYLVQKKGFAHYSMRDLIIEEIRKQGLEQNRVNMGLVGTGLRHERGPAYFTETFIARAEAAGVKDYVIESIRSLAEAANIRAHGGFIAGVDAPRDVRYARILARGSSTDQVTLEEFRAQEEAEYRPADPNDPALMNVLGVLEGADYAIQNNGTQEEFEASVEAMLAAFGSR